MGCKKLTYKNKLRVLRGGLPPGPPNLKFIYAQQALADERANSELVANLTLLNNLSLAYWQQQNTEKDPGPPICQPPFCNTGGDINSGTLPENDIYFFHPDHLGSTSYITNIAGETVQFNTYMPFGESFVSQQRFGIVSQYTFLSKEKDLETGLHYLSARYYNSQLSVFLSIDPLWEQTGDPYGYSYRNPIKYLDPTGMKADWHEDKDNPNVLIKDKGDNANTLKDFVNKKYEDAKLSDKAANNLYNSIEKDKVNLDQLNTETLNKNKLKTNYIGGNNPRKYNGESDYSIKPKIFEIPAYLHDLDYDKIRASGLNGLLINVATKEADDIFVKRMNVLQKKYEQSNNIIMATKAFAVKNLLNILSSPKVPVYNNITKPIENVIDKIKNIDFKINLYPSDGFYVPISR